MRLSSKPTEIDVRRTKHDYDDDDHDDDDE